MFKKTLFLISLFLVLTGCYQSTASLIGPTVTLGTSGNIVQSAVSYSVNESVKKTTGEYPAVHIKKRFEKSKIKQLFSYNKNLDLSYNVQTDHILQSHKI